MGVFGVVNVGLSVVDSPGDNEGGPDQTDRGPSRPGKLKLPAQCYQYTGKVSFMVITRLLTLESDLAWTEKIPKSSGCDGNA